VSSVTSSRPKGHRKSKLPRQYRDPLALGAYSLTLGIVLVLLAGVLAAIDYVQGRPLTYTSATVVEKLDHMDPPTGNIITAPKLRFSNGACLITVVSKQESASSSLSVGDTLRVRFSPVDPTDVHLARRMDLYGIPVYLAVAGVILFDIGFALLWLGSPRILSTEPEPHLRETPLP